MSAEPKRYDVERLYIEYTPSLTDVETRYASISVGYNYVSDDKRDYYSALKGWYEEIAPPCDGLTEDMLKEYNEHMWDIIERSMDELVAKLENSEEGDPVSVKVDECITIGVVTTEDEWRAEGLTDCFINELYHRMKGTSIEQVIEKLKERDNGYGR